MMLRVSFYQNGLLMLEGSQDGQNWTQITLQNGDVYGWQDPQGGNWYIDVGKGGAQGTVSFRNDQGVLSEPPSYPQTNDPVSVSSRFWEQNGGGGGGGGGGGPAVVAKTFMHQNLSGAGGTHRDLNAETGLIGTVQVNTNNAGKITGVTEGVDVGEVVVWQQLSSLEAALTADISDLRSEVTDDLASALSIEVANREAAVSDLDDRLSTEASIREAADGSLDTALSTEASIREEADGSLDTALSVEASIREAADVSLDTALSVEASIREEADGSLDTALSIEASVREEADGSLDTALSAEASMREDADGSLDLALSVEASIREEADGSLDTALSIEASVREEADGSLDTALSIEASVREEADGSLDTALSIEASVREEADGSLDTALSIEASVREEADGSLDKALSVEASIREAADVSLDTALSIEASVREEADGSLDTALSVEASVREAADDVLASRIDAILSGTSEDLDQFIEVINAFQSADGSIDAAISGVISQKTSALESLEDALVSTIDAKHDQQDADISDLRSALEGDISSVDVVLADHEERLVNLEPVEHTANTTTAAGTATIVPGLPAYFGDKDYGSGVFYAEYRLLAVGEGGEMGFLEDFRLSGTYNGTDAVVIAHNDTFNLKTIGSPGNLSVNVLTNGDVEVVQQGANVGFKWLLKRMHITFVEYSA